MNETFLLSNIAPQVGDGFNRHCRFSLASSLVLSNALQIGRTSRNGAGASLEVFKMFMSLLCLFTYPDWKQTENGVWSVFQFSSTFRVKRLGSRHTK